MENQITKDDLLILLKGQSEKSELASKYQAWSKLNKDDVSKLTPMGSLSVNQRYNEEFPSVESYWSPTYPIALNYYPYHGCDIYTDGVSYFFIYQDFGGHIPERRCRLVQKELIV